MTDKKLEDMSKEELDAYNEELEKQIALKKAQKLKEEADKIAKDEKQAELDRIKSEAIEEYKKEELKKLANANDGSATKNADKIQNTKVSNHPVLDIASSKIRNGFEHDKEVLGLSANRQIDDIPYEDLVKRLKSGHYRK